MRYLAGLAHGDFGPSFHFKDFRVTELIAQGLPVSLTLGLAAALLAFLLGVPLGASPPGARTRAPDHALMGFALLGIALPGFVVGPLLALVFGIYWPCSASRARSPATRATWCCRWSRWRCR